MTQRYLVTGGAGVIGSELVPKLVAAGHRVWVGDLKPRPATFAAEVQYRQGDVNELRDAEIRAFDPHVIIHLAAKFQRSAETSEFWDENYHHNIALSHHVMTLARKLASLRRVVFASSYLIYSPELYQRGKPAAEAVSLRETDPVLPRNLTGMAKLAHEIELRFLSDQTCTRFSSVSARIFRGYGRASRDVISRWIRTLLDGQPIDVYNPQGLFDYIYARDTAEGLMRLAADEHVSGVVNLGTGAARRVQDVVDILQDHFPELELISHDDEFPIECSQADMSLWCSQIDWLPETSLEAAIAEMIDHERGRRLETTTSANRSGGVLVTSSAAKVPLIRAVKAALARVDSESLVWAADLDANAITRYVADGFFRMPVPCDAQAAALLAECKQRRIDVIIPTRDGELAFWAARKSEYLEHGIHVLVSPLESVERCLDKYQFAAFSCNEGLRMIPAALSIQELEGSEATARYYVVKERYGSGARSIGLKLGRIDAIEHAKKLDSPIFQPFIEGREFSVDAWLDRNGKVHGLVMRWRDVVINGESRVTTTFHEPRLEPVLAEFLEQLDLRGPIVLQVLMDSAGKLHVIECNARFGGASTASVAAGLDAFFWSLMEARGESVGCLPFVRIPDGVRQVRMAVDEYRRDTDL